jgi:hypothetical protein
MANKKYLDWDSVVVQLLNGGESIVAIQMHRQDLEILAESHGEERSKIIELMLQTLEGEMNKKNININ